MNELSRRSALRILGAAGCVAGTVRADDAPLRFRDLDHIEFTVANVERSIDFYSRIFGNAVLKNNQTTRRYLKLGANYLAVDKAAATKVDHFCAGIDNFDIATLHARLMGQGIAYRDYPSGKDLSVTDPDGLRTQLAASNGWEQLQPGVASPEHYTLSGEPIFRPVGIDSVLLGSEDDSKSLSFYQPLFGRASLELFTPMQIRTSKNGLADNTLTLDASGDLPRPPVRWFKVGRSRIGVENLPQGRQAGVRLFSVLVQSFDPAAVSDRLQQMGAKLETPDLQEGVQFRDPDGFSVQVLERRG